MAWNPFGVSLEISASGGTVTRKSATQYTVKINAAWETYYSGAKTNYGMTASSGGGSVTLNPFGTNSSGNSGSFTGTYSISGNGSATKTITVTFKNFNDDNGKSATKTVSFNVTVPAWTSYTVKYNANGGSGAPSSQTKWKDQTLTLSSTKPTRTGYTFKGWATSSTATSATYSAGGSYTANAAATLYAVWKANTYTVTYNANGGSLGSVANQTKTYGVTLTLTTAKPTKSGYNFKGWATSATATAITYASGASYTANAAITLYAVWELAYKKPTVTKFSVNRCDANGNITDEGTYLLFAFNWSCYETVTEILLSWASADGEVTGSQTVTASGTSGTVSEIVGNGTITTEKTFTVNAVVTDSQSTTKTGSIGCVELPLEAVYDEATGKYGVAFGKVAELTETADFNYEALHRKHITFENNKVIYGTKPDGRKWEAFNPQNANGNTVMGYDNYENKEGNTNIYGFDINIGVSNIATPGTFRPYMRQGMSATVTLRTAGYVTNSKTEVHFIVPLSRSVIGSPTVTVTSGNGFILRQGGNYTHGSTASIYVTPTKYTATLDMDFGVLVCATFSDVTNAINNDAIGIYWHGTITFT